MTLAIRQSLGWLLLAVALALSSGSASAHPHVWITATSELIYAPDGSITGVRHAWTFDDMYLDLCGAGHRGQDQGRSTAARSWARWHRPTSSR